MEDKLIGEVKYKSPYAYYVVGLTGLALLLIPGKTSTKIIGVLLILLTLINRFFIKDRTVIKVYPDHIKIDPEGEDMVIANSEITEWNINSHGQYAVYILKNDGTSSFIRTFDTVKAQELLKKTIPDKSTLKMTLSSKMNKEDGFLHALANKIRSLKNGR